MKNQFMDRLIGSLQKLYHTSMNEMELEELWVPGIADLSPEQLVTGFKNLRAGKTDKFFPTVGEFRKYAGVEQNENTAVTRAWLLLWKTVEGHVGTEKTIDWEDTALAETIRNMGGLEIFGSTLVTEKNFLKKLFTELYLQNSQRSGLDSLTMGRDKNSQQVARIGYTAEEQLPMFESQKKVFLPDSAPLPDRTEERNEQIKQAQALKTPTERFSFLTGLVESANQKEPAKEEHKFEKSGREYPLGDTRRIAAERKKEQEVAQWLYQLKNPSMNEVRAEMMN